MARTEGRKEGADCSNALLDLVFRLGGACFDKVSTNSMRENSQISGIVGEGCGSGWRMKSLEVTPSLSATGDVLSQEE
jgi:hypothetical protein